MELEQYYYFYGGVFEENMMKNEKDYYKVAFSRRLRKEKGKRN